MEEDYIDMNKKQWNVFGFVFMAFMVYFFLLSTIFHFPSLPVTSSGAWGVYVLSNLKCTIYMSFSILCFAIGLACLICGWLEKGK